MENNLAAVRILTQVIQERDSAIGSARRTLDEASVRYHSGIDSYLNVITAQTALLNAREAALTFYRAVVGRHIRIGMLLP